MIRESWQGMKIHSPIIYQHLKQTELLGCLPPTTNDETFKVDH